MPTYDAAASLCFDCVRDVGQLHQRSVQKANNLNGLASLFDARGHRWPAHQDVRGISLLLAQGDGIRCPVVHPQGLESADRLQCLHGRALGVALGWRLEPLQMAARGRGGGCIGPVDGLAQRRLPNRPVTLRVTPPNRTLSAQSMEAARYAAAKRTAMLAKSTT